MKPDKEKNMQTTAAAKNRAAEKPRNERWDKYVDSLKFALYCITHPLDGFWDLTHEHRGTMAAANTILIVTLLVRILKLKYTSFVIMAVYWEDLNIFLYLASVLFPLALWVIGNWALTTLFDGKGRLPQVYMATCYALTPYPLIQLPLMILMNIDDQEIIFAATLLINGMNLMKLQIQLII